MIRSLLHSLLGRKRKLDPLTVGYSDALSFFTDRRVQYVESAHTLSRFVTPEDDFIDVGANIGYFSLEFMKFIGFKGHAYLFEPVPNLAKHCVTSFEGLPFKVTVHSFALGDMDGKATVYTADDGNIGWNTLVATKASHAMQEITIETRRFDSLGIDLETVGAIKIDVEGGEYQVLSGMLPSLERSRRLPVLLVEVGWGKNHPNWALELDMFNRLETLGYSALNLDGTIIDLGSIEKTRDVLFVPGRFMPCFQK